MVSEKRLKELFDYDPETGFFVRKISVSVNAKKGDVAKTISTCGYIVIVIDGVQYKAHRLAWLYVFGIFPKRLIDHVNGIKTDNRISNLRDSDHSLNAENQRKSMSHSKTKCLGVVSRPYGRYEANIQVNKKPKYLGTFLTVEEASNAYIEAKRKLHKACTI